MASLNKTSKRFFCTYLLDAEFLFQKFDLKNSDWFQITLTWERENRFY